MREFSPDDQQAVNAEEAAEVLEEVKRNLEAQRKKEEQRLEKERLGNKSLSECYQHCGLMAFDIWELG